MGSKVFSVILLPTLEFECHIALYGPAAWGYCRGRIPSGAIGGSVNRIVHGQTPSEQGA
jgi:hypothetical protein